MEDYVVSLAASGRDEVGRVGGKNASLGEMIGHLDRLGIRVPEGFATTAGAFGLFLAQDGLDAAIHELLDDLDVDDTGALARDRRADQAHDPGHAAAAGIDGRRRRRMEETGQRRGHQRGGALVGDGRGPPRGFLRRTAGHAAQRLRAGPMSSPASTTSTLRCSTTGPSPTACISASTTARFRCLWACSAWCGAIWPRPESCSHWTRNPVSGTWC